MKMHNRQKNEPGRAITLVLDAQSGAAADGLDTNEINVTLQSNGTVVSGEAIDLSALSGTALFPGSLNHITVVTNILGQASAELTDTVAEDVTVRATVLDNPSVTQEAISTFGEGGHSELPLPVVREAINGTLNASLSKATVDVEKGTGMMDGEAVTLFWNGTKEDGSTTRYQDNATFTDAAVLTFIVPGEQQIRPVAGGRVDIFYQVSGLTSPALTLDVISGEGGRLPVPSVREAPGGVLNGNQSSATVDIAPYTAMAPGDFIELGWNGDVTGQYTTGFTVSGGTAGKTISISVPGSQIAGNRQVALNYTVRPASGGALLVSWPLGLQIV